MMISGVCLLLAVLVLVQNYFLRPVTERISPLVSVSGHAYTAQAWTGELSNLLSLVKFPKVRVM